MLFTFNATVATLSAHARRAAKPTSFAQICLGKSSKPVEFCQHSQSHFATERKLAQKSKTARALVFHKSEEVHLFWRRDSWGDASPWDQQVKMQLLHREANRYQASSFNLILQVSAPNNAMQCNFKSPKTEVQSFLPLSFSPRGVGFKICNWPSACTSLPALVSPWRPGHLIPGNGSLNTRDSQRLHSLGKKRENYRMILPLLSKYDVGISY